MGEQGLGIRRKIKFSLIPAQDGSLVGLKSKGKFMSTHDKDRLHEQTLLTNLIVVSIFFEDPF